MLAFSRRSLLRISSFLKALTLALVLLLAPLPVPAAESLSVVVDQAKLIKLPEKIATIVVGNPLIADVSLQPGGTMVVTGKGYGTTNVMALDRNGTILLDRVVQVEGPTDKLVTVYRGIDRESYSCTPTCQRRITLGDAQTYFSATLGQSGSLASQAGGGESQAQPGASR
jgi:Flp pilus assembly secretin CpaC